MDLDALLRAQDGLVSRDQALACGLSADRVDRKLAAGRWVRVHPRVYLGTDRLLDARARVRAAALWAGDDATVVGVAAAWWWGLLERPPSVVDLAVPPQRRLAPPAGVRIVRRRLARADRDRARGVWVTELPLSVLDAAGALGAGAGGQLLDRVLQSELPFRILYLAHCRTLGRRGSASAGAMLGQAADRAASHAERVLHRLLRGAGITGWVGGVELRLDGVGRVVLDLAFPAARVAIEVDGWAWHHSPDRFRHDRRRQNALVLAGWTILRFTWSDLVERPNAVVCEISAAVARCGRDDRREQARGGALKTL